MSTFSKVLILSTFTLALPTICAHDSQSTMPEKSRTRRSTGPGKTYVAFSDAAQAIAFEKYLKSASGRAFAKKRL